MSHSLSRRDFVRLAAGTLAYLPRVAGIPGAFALAAAPSVALAQETDLTDEVPPAHIVIIDPDELGIQVVDVASGLALANAHVTITSYAEGAKASFLEGDTDYSGVWVSKVADLCEPDGLARPYKAYEFYARIEVTKDGYRPFTTALVRVIAGKGLAVATQPIVAGQPYPRMASFNMYDILYTANEFVRTSKNNTTCTMELLIENLDASDNITAQLYQNDTPLNVKGTFANEQGTAHIRFEGTYLNTSIAGVFELGSGYNFHLTYATAASPNVEMIVPVSLVILNSPPEVQEPILSSTLEKEEGKRYTFSPFNRVPFENSGVKLPDVLPIIGGNKLKIWTPESFLGFAVDPYGFIRISVQTPPLGWKNIYGKVDDKKFGFHPHNDISAQIDKYKDDIRQQAEKWNQFKEGWNPFTGGRGNPEALTSDQPTENLGITATGIIEGILQWEPIGEKPFWETKNLTGYALFHVTACVNYQFKEQFVAGCIPLIFSFGVNSSIDVGYSKTVHAPSLLDYFGGNYEMDVYDTGLYINFCLMITISIGIGIDGLLSISLKGIVSFTIYLGLITPEAPDLPKPHFTFSMGLVVKVVIQFLLFTEEFVPLPKVQEALSDKEPLYDNWKTNNLTDYLQGDDERKSLYEFLTDGSVIVGDDALAARAEYALSYTPDAATVLRENLTGMLRAVPQTFTTDDGTPYTTYVYVPVSQERFEMLKQAALSVVEQTEGTETNLSALLTRASSEELGLLAAEDYDVIPVFSGSTETISNDVSFLGPEGRFSYGRPAAGIGSLGLEAGVCPTSDVTVSQDVFSDPRAKVVSIFGRLCVVRIATVKLSIGSARTRLVLQEVPSDGGEGVHLLLDFVLAVGRYPRYEYFDYSFDIIQTATTDENGNERCDLHLLVLSGRREDDDETELTTAAQGHIFSYVRYSFTDPSDLTARSVVAMQVTPDKIHATDCPEDWDSHVYLSPQIKLVEQNGQKACAMCFVDRAGSDEIGTLNDQSADDTRVGIGMFFAKVVDGGSKEAAPVISVPDLSALRDKLGSMDDLMLTEMSLMGTASGFNTIKFGGNTAHYLLLGVNPGFTATITAQEETYEENAASISQILRVSDDALTAVLTDPNETRLELQEALGQDFMLTCANGQLQKATWGNIDTGSPVPLLEPCGPEDTQINAFAVDPSGEFIYWQASYDGDAPVQFDAEGNPKPTEERHLHRIMACRMRNGVFSKPFPLAEQNTHAIDTLRVLESNHEGVSFISSEVVDAFQGQGNIWFTVVPHLRCLTVAYMAPEMAILHVGDEVSFRIALRNDGNTYLKQATIRLTTSWDNDAEVLAEHTLVFSEENTLPSMWNPQDADGRPTGVESDYALAPGATSLYHIPGFVIPEGAPHDIYVCASIVEGTVAMADGTGLMGAADGLSQEFFGQGFKTVATGDRVVAGEAELTVVEGTEVGIDTSHLHPSNVEIRTSGNGGRSDSGGSSSGGNGGRNGQSGKSSKGRGILPKMGDDTAGLGATGAALGAAGAAMVAYSHRREKLAREAEEAEAEE